jgi:hypothetical protein
MRVILLSTSSKVYMLLSDIVSGQAGNAAAFRKELMGGYVQ